MNQPILIQGAMPIEVETFVGKLQNMEKETIQGFSFWKGQVKQHQIVVSLTDIGTIHATCATTLGILTYQPKIVINQGIAGSHREDLHVGDIVIGESCIPICDLMTPSLGKGEGSHPEHWFLHEWRERAPGETYHWHGDSTWVDAFDKAVYQGGKKIKGRLGSGDVFNREYDRILQVQALCNQDCEDMESIAIYQVCRWLQNTPVVGIRIISNNELTGELYQPEVASKLQEFIYNAVLQQGVSHN